MKPIYSRRGIQIYQGDCIEVMANLKAQGNLHASSVITSPPYANQRKPEYRSVHPKDYPTFTSEYFEAIRPILADDGSIFIVIRPNISKGQIDDFVLKTRLKIREKWTECEELIWIKPNSAPVGSIRRPRRSWESILWYGKSGHVYCDTKCDKIKTERVGFQSSKHYMQSSAVIKSGFARTKDYICIGTQKIDSGLCHPAIFPVELPSWLIRLSSRKQDIILDPFMGSGSTAIACLREQRNFIGVDLDPYYVENAIKRIEVEFSRVDLQLELELACFGSQTKLESDTVKSGTIVEF